MEKRGVIEPGLTPEEQPKDTKNEKHASDTVARLDADFRKRAAETVVKITTPK
jgi:hypothetical protein